MTATDHARNAETAIIDAISELSAFNLEAEPQNDDAELIYNALDDLRSRLQSIYNSYKFAFNEATYEPEQHDEADWREER